MKTVFFEITVGNVVRYNCKILPPMPGDILVVYDIRSDFMDIENHVVCFKSWSAKQLREFFRSNSVERLVINSFRMTDCAAVSVAKSLGLKVCYVQHGLYQPFVKRSFSFFRNVGKLYNFSRLFFSTYGVSCETVTYPLALLGFGSRRAFSQRFLSIDTAFFWSSFWRDWHAEQHWVHPDEVFLVGDPNVGQMNYEKCSCSNCILFVSQSLVEDSRCKFADYIDVLSKIYCRCTSLGKILYVRFHPRQSQMVKNAVLGLGFLEDNGVGFFSFCIAGHSSIIPSIASRGIPIILIDLDGDTIPISILRLGTLMPIEEISFSEDYKVASPSDLEYFWGIGPPS